MELSTSHQVWAAVRQKYQKIICVVGIGVVVHCYDDTVIIMRDLFDHTANGTNKLNVVACLIESHYVSRGSHVENRGERKNTG